MRRTYLAALPPGYAGQFGPGIKALALVQYFTCNMAEPKILEFFANIGIHLSAGELSNWLIKDWPELHAEKAAIYAAGLRSSPWQHLDDTATRSMVRMRIVMWCAIRCIRPTLRRPARTG